ncbi:hypothetical protein W97_07207 [Coniosporium apollinis CBS 100218]|uniref:Uncharacterized protein n=1 Tax=Coniosporium apollinis (strain CBS 100218) TaxID=1168221 RepID=R7Z1Z4_CONA1|nr:uncharacterized protein W97_07207 [Coniosporium apollinis CBS 100218]EON68059.1 hypothetical protein W97_07207 [Coniosporium apollinis CBS 100218]
MFWINGIGVRERDLPREVTCLHLQRWGRCGLGLPPLLRCYVLHRDDNNWDSNGPYDCVNPECPGHKFPLGPPCYGPQGVTLARLFCATGLDRDSDQLDYPRAGIFAMEIGALIEKDIPASDWHRLPHDPADDPFEAVANAFGFFRAQPDGDFDEQWINHGEAAVASLNRPARGPRAAPPRSAPARQLALPAPPAPSTPPARAKQLAIMPAPRPAPPARTESAPAPAPPGLTKRVPVAHRPPPRPATPVYEEEYPDEEEYSEEGCAEEGCSQEEYAEEEYAEEETPAEEDYAVEQYMPEKARQESEVWEDVDAAIANSLRDMRVTVQVTTQHAPAAGPVTRPAPRRTQIQAPAVGPSATRPGAPQRANTGTPKNAHPAQAQAPRPAPGPLRPAPPQHAHTTTPQHSQYTQAPAPTSGSSTRPAQLRRASTTVAQPPHQTQTHVRAAGPSTSRAPPTRPAHSPLASIAAPPVQNDDYSPCVDISASAFVGRPIPRNEARAGPPSAASKPPPSGKSAPAGKSAAASRPSPAGKSAPAPKPSKGKSRQPPPPRQTRAPRPAAPTAPAATAAPAAPAARRGPPVAQYYAPQEQEEEEAPPSYYEVTGEGELTYNESTGQWERLE